MPFQSRHFSTGRPKSALFFCSNSHFLLFPLDFPKKKCYTEPIVGIRWEVSVVRAAFGVFCISSCVILCFLHPCRRRICAFFGYRLVGVPFWYVGADFLPAGYRLFRLPRRICAFHIQVASVNLMFQSIPAKMILQLRRGKRPGCFFSRKQKRHRPLVNCTHSLPAQSTGQERALCGKQGSRPSVRKSGHS